MPVPDSLEEGHRGGSAETDLVRTAAEGPEVVLQKRFWLVRKQKMRSWIGKHTLLEQLVSQLQVAF